MSAEGKVQAQLVEVQDCRFPAECSRAGLLHFQSLAQILLPAIISQNLRVLYLLYYEASIMKVLLRFPLHLSHI